MYPEYIFILENIQREIETICTKKHYKYGNYYNFTNPLDVRLKGFSQVEGGTSQSNWLPTYYILSFFFLIQLLQLVWCLLVQLASDCQRKIFHFA